jgi:hypothetical protein
MHVVNSGHIVLPLKLDGRDIDAILDLGSTYSQISMEFAHNLFGLDAASAGMERTGQISGSVQTTVYRHTFKTLSLEGLTINNPTLYIWDNLVKYSATQAPPIGSRLNNLQESEGHTDLTLGLSQLNHLHVYIAYKEQKLYITPSAAPVSVAASAPVSATSTAPVATPSGAAASH